jgi:hypothetical protein
MLTSFKKHANKPKKPYFDDFTCFLSLFVKNTSALSACALRRTIRQPTPDHPQKFRARTQLLFRPEQLVKHVFAREPPCNLVYSL